EDTGGVHGGNRLGGNGVANSTVFGGIAGDSMAGWVPEHGKFREPDAAEIDAAVARCRKPLGVPTGDVAELREELYELMWREVGVFRSAAGLQRADAALTELGARLDRTGVAGDDLAFNLTWHDWLNLDSLLLVSRAIIAASLARDESRGAHFRSDFPETRPEAQGLAFTKISLAGEHIALDWGEVTFSRIKPGESLIAEDAA
ncbi:MAG: succinate dehydrogenase/fumarate reductase flavoprotein subunit, partial [Alphaproteobacteria bacterium]|nr:succinate dehydrogenase/fumarate reductase flavoprotein subunit [Alphaproteobacteria bacterium]